MPLLAAIAPFAVWPVEFFLPFPYVIEEVAKGFLVKRADGLMMAVVVGIVFAFSESVFFFRPLITNGVLAVFFLRFVLGGLLHTLTCILYFKLKWKALWWTVPIHFFYNLWFLNKY